MDNERGMRFEKEHKQEIKATESHKRFLIRSGNMKLVLGRLV